MSNNITFEIKEKITVLNQNQSGWNKELNIVSWNEGALKYDIREWNEDHTQNGKIRKDIYTMEGGFFYE